MKDFKYDVVIIDYPELLTYNNIDVELYNSFNLMIRKINLKKVRKKRFYQ